MQQKHKRSISAEVPVNKSEGQLHEHRRHKRKQEREPLPNLVTVGAVRRAQIEGGRCFGCEQRHRHKYRTGESHPHSLSHREKRTAPFPKDLPPHAFVHWPRADSVTEMLSSLELAAVHLFDRLFSRRLPVQSPGGTVGGAVNTLSTHSCRNRIECSCLWKQVTCSEF